MYLLEGEGVQSGVSLDALFYAAEWLAGQDAQRGLRDLALAFLVTLRVPRLPLSHRRQGGIVWLPYVSLMCLLRGTGRHRAYRTAIA